jgi:hypothetical protein
MIKKWNVDEVLRQVSSMKYAATDPNMTGWVQWPIKQDLYRLKWAIDQALDDCPTFVDEPEFLEEHNKQVMWKALNEKTNR